MKKDYEMNIIELLQEGLLRKFYLMAERCASVIPDKIYLKIVYYIRLRKKLKLTPPVTLNEKLQWLKLYDREPRYTNMVDKYAVKKLVADLIGEDHVIPVLGVWEHFDEIDFDELPDQFVLKCTHDSGSVIICRDKKIFDVKKARKKMESALKRNYFWGGREWPYKNVPRRIIAEPFIPSLGNEDSKEYKITCFNGRFGFTTICTGKAHDKLSVRKNDHYDAEFKPLPFWSYYEHSGHPVVEKPVELDEIIEYAVKIAKGIPYLRVDFYVINDQIYFGEATFFTWGGFNKFVPEEWDEKLGNMLDLPKC